MILVVNVCSEKLHYLEFVKPIVDIVGECRVIHYLDLKGGDLELADKVIICGTSLKDDEYLSGDFSWMKDFGKPLLGICAGMQIIGLVNGFDLKKGQEIGFFKERFDEDFLGIKGEVEVYHLHNNYVSGCGDDWVKFGGEIVQAVKKGKIYGVLFHPEVRNREMIKEFVEL